MVHTPGHNLDTHCNTESLATLYYDSNTAKQTVLPVGESHLRWFSEIHLEDTTYIHWM